MQQGNKWHKLLTFIIFPINIDIYVIILEMKGPEAVHYEHRQDIQVDSSFTHTFSTHESGSDGSSAGVESMLSTA
jgi:hypothetical protein